MSLASKLIANIESMRGNLLSSWEAGNIIKAIQDRTVEFKVPESVRCKFDSSYSVGMFWCSRCGAIYNWRSVAAGSKKCANCGSELAQSYLFAPYFSSKPNRAPDLERMISTVYSDENSWCPLLNCRKNLKRDDLERPVESLSWYCPDPQGKRLAHCDYRDSVGFCQKTERTYGNWTTRRGHVRLSKPAQLDASKLGAAVQFRPSPALPSEGVTKSLQTSVHSYSDEHTKSLDFHQMLLPGIQSIHYARDLTAISFSLAVAVGYPTASLYSRTMIINENEDAEGERKIVILSRRLSTKAIIVRPKPYLFTGLEQKPQEVSKILHTISHAFLLYLPLVTGLEPTEFYESIDIDKREIAIYDSEPGGIGGVGTVVWGDELSSNYQEKIKESVDCDLDCVSACKACLYVENCGRLNRQLNRHLLIDGGVISVA